MNPGDLDRRIVIKNQTTVNKNNGERQISFSTYATRWASVKYKNGKEDDEALEITSVQDVIFTIRWDSNIDTTYSVTYNGKDHNIESVNPIGRKDFIELYTRATS